jgi:hypothetical protein
MAFTSAQPATLKVNLNIYEATTAIVLYVTSLVICFSHACNKLNPSHLFRFNYFNNDASIPVAARSKTWVCGRSLARIVGSKPEGGMDVPCECCVLSGKGLCVGLITRPEKSYRGRCV